ncbi:hypothetical protein FACUT_14108 [Fusarium acutatum]|uniref:Uncharacterized protein n=1 Tax=Fusarium acutatum TaxID=78861 RepID=A0A8H4ND76_9HYPO|nr:hypothetical protein FACUT_14108 [Fusarium acutatum]
MTQPQSFEACHRLMLQESIKYNDLMQHVNSGQVYNNDDDQSEYEIGVCHFSTRMASQKKSYQADAAYMGYAQPAPLSQRKEASRKTWKYERPYKLKGWNDEKNYEQVLERIDDIEAGRIRILPLTTRMYRLSCLPQQTPSKLSLRDAPSVAFWEGPHKDPRFKPDEWLSEKEYLFF